MSPRWNATQGAAAFAHSLWKVLREDLLPGAGKTLFKQPEGTEEESDFARIQRLPEEKWKELVRGTLN